ncbi:Uncharacterized protein OS=Chthoniobacter flavus Ellin428 GN=CfE428DRAFT_6462 PE=4 SV=1: PSD3: PSD5: PSD4: PSCyt3: PSD2 [Gemmataceae bacterium]|nr:Uncharacterized protein OS=Chthoniobacter flavus Ellin428 GN=CfE428DRAFT_6462 PE=4 SV=1: PSD3: PSD5: PSD4: PSCyt3: PSD2 [Gemmataceae bacterium]VTT98475.1 Uncharacterized protein OS=Chthoniobacter flavus Ellin428 GN=CfE428DRAFT_6462 PE=4 SV=1: PSD3: PSD5: PSD4: PSCyt3: PSD2 [Gemmataceae bacterium]
MIRTAVITLYALWFAGAAAAAGPAKPLLEKHCGDCHSGNAPQGKFRIDTLPAAPDTLEGAKRWGRVVARLDAGTMPPSGSERPPAADVAAVLTWAKTELASAAKAYRPNGRARLRRLNRLEYENTVHDLLGVRTPLRDLLPADDTADGFDTAAQALTISPVHISRYMDAASAALRDAAVRGPKPESVTTRFSYDHEKEKYFMTHGNNQPVIRPRNGGEVHFFSEPHIEVPARLNQFAERTRTSPGRYKVRVSAYTQDAKGESLAYLVRTTQSRELLGYFDAPPDKPGVVEVEHWFGPNDTVVVAPYRLNDARRARKFSQYPPKPWREPDGLALAIQWVEVEGPLNEAWPPVGHGRLYGDSPLKPFKELPKDVVTPGPLQALRNTDKLTPVPADAAATAKAAVRDFLARAFRRPVTDDDAAPYLALVTERLAKNECFESAMRAAHVAALCSPDFLFLVEEPGPLTDHALAARLAYFLWRTAPDDALRAAADRGELRRPEVLRRETDRMLASPRSAAFVNDFLDQWLHLRDIDATMPDKLLFPEYYEEQFSSKIDGLLRESLLAETRMGFADLLKTDGGVRHLVDSDHTFLNNRLAEFYGLPAVAGVGMRKTKLPAGSVRGGVLTQGSVLKVTANGANTSPVVRGAWVLDAVLGRPPAPPPPNVGAIEPDTRGATTIREQLAKHQSTKSCAACHAHIDPPGFALEAFDPIGQYRENYRSTEKGDVLNGVAVGGVNVKYRKGPKVDPSGTLPDGREFTGPAAFKAMLVKEPETVARCLVSKLATFATGHAIEPADLSAVDGIVAAAKPRGYGVRTLVHELVQSDLFRNK